MKKIQVTTVPMTSQAEVIVLNSAFVANAVRAAVVAKNAKEDLEHYITKAKEEAVPFNAYDVNISMAHAVELVENTLTFVLELEKALLGEEEGPKTNEECDNKQLSHSQHKGENNSSLLF